MSDSLKKNNKKQAIHLLAHFVWATWTILSQSLILYERPEQIAYITHFWLAPWAIRLFVWGMWANRSHCSLKRGIEGITSFFNL